MSAIFLNMIEPFYKHDTVGCVSMRFSVLVPVYNVEKYIDYCVKSIVDQSFSDYEVILVDDGSTDSSGTICDRYASKYSKIRVVHQDNCGLIGARRRGIQEARGEYCVFLDSDDFLELNTLEELDKIIQQLYPDMIIYNSYVYDGAEKNRFNCPKFREGLVNEKKKIFETLFLTYTINSLCMKTVKRSVIDIDQDYTFFYDCNYGEDILQSVPLFLNSDKIYYLPKALYNYRYDSGMMRKYNKKYYYSYKKVNHQIRLLMKDKLIDENIYSLLDFHLVIAAYGGTTQFRFKSDFKLNELKPIAEDSDFSKAYSRLKKTSYYENLSKKQRIVLFLLYHKFYGAIKILLGFSRR